MTDFTFQEGDRVEYAAHPVSWQAGHNETDQMHHLADGRFPLPATVTEEEAEAHRNIHPDAVPVPEDWRPATVVSTMHHPAMPHLNKFEKDEVVKLQPDDGQPPFDLNVLLVRPLTT